MEKNKKELFEPEQLYKTEIGLASQLKSWCFYWKWFLLQEVLFRVAELGPATRDTCLRKWSYRDTDREFFIEENLGRKIWVPSNGVVYIKSSWPIGGRKLFSIRKFIHSESSKFLCLTISLLGKKKKETQNLGSLSYKFSWGSQWRSLNGNPPLGCKWKFRNRSFWIIHEQSTLRFWTLCLRIEELNKGLEMVIIKEQKLLFRWLLAPRRSNQV